MGEKRHRQNSLELFRRVLHDSNVDAYSQDAKWVMQMLPEEAYADLYRLQPELLAEGSFTLYGIKITIDSSMPSRTCELWNNDELLATFVLPEKETAQDILDRLGDVSVSTSLK